MPRAREVREINGRYEYAPDGTSFDWGAFCDDLEGGYRIEEVEYLRGWILWERVYRVTSPEGEEWLYFVEGRGDE